MHTIPHLRAVEDNTPPMTFTVMRRSAILTPLQASADQRNLALLRSVKAMAKRMGFTIKDGEIIDEDALNNAIKDQPVRDRLALKSNLYMLRLITP
jgi:hypothetical protein